jgi:hypothetical protein
VVPHEELNYREAVFSHYPETYQERKVPVPPDKPVVSVSRKPLAGAETASPEPGATSFNAGAHRSAQLVKTAPHTDMPTAG